jgi:hypothetical protein
VGLFSLRDYDERTSDEKIVIAREIDDVAPR